MPRALRLPLACLIGAISWAISEVGGGLAFLAAGVRLWRYQVVPLFSDITSPVVWTIAGLLIVPVMLLFDRVFRTEQLSPRRRAAARLGFMMLVGPVLEVLINRHVFMTLFGEPLYLYTYLPTFQGSGSLLSPFYYATLYIHVPVADRLLGARLSNKRGRAREGCRRDQGVSTEPGVGSPASVDATQRSAADLARPEGSGPSYYSDGRLGATRVGL